MNENKRKPIKCIENGKVFKSATECEKVSVEIFGTKLLQANISAVCILVKR